MVAYCVLANPANVCTHTHTHTHPHAGAAACGFDARQRSMATCLTLTCRQNTHTRTHSFARWRCRTYIWYKASRLDKLFYARKHTLIRTLALPHVHLVQSLLFRQAVLRTQASTHSFARWRCCTCIWYKASRLDKLFYARKHTLTHSHAGAAARNSGTKPLV